MARLPTTPRRRITTVEDQTEETNESNLPDLDQEFEALGGDSVDDFASGAEADLNNPDVIHLGDAPQIGGRSRSVDLFGETADYAAGRVTSPKLYAQAAQFPTCAQLRVWKWENGIPVGLGTIDSSATEEDLVRQFFSAMPRKGEGRAQFKLRPIDIRGQELGQEVTIVVSEHHSAIRAMKEAEAEENERTANPFSFMQAPSSSSGEIPAELSRMVEHMLATAESRSKQLEDSLEMERERIRQEELRRTQERVDLATNAAQGVQVITERMMKDEQIRAERAAKMQAEQSQLLITTLTSIFAQQQSMSAQASESARRADEYRIEQERQRAERERQMAEDRRKMEMQEAEYRRQRDREEAEYRLRLEREESDRKRLEIERTIAAQKAEMELRIAREREEAEARRRENEAKLAHEREEAARRFEQARLELELKLNREREEMERKERREREEAERRERWFAEERARRESRESTESREREQERQRQHDRMVKELELQAQKDREHAERMVSLSKAEQSATNGDVLSSAAKLFSQFGVPPNEIFKRLFSQGETEDVDDGEEKASPWMEALPKIFGIVGDVAKAAANRGPAGMPGQMPQGGMPPEMWQQQAQAQPQGSPAPQRRALLPANVPEQFAQPRAPRTAIPRRMVEQEMQATVDQAMAAQMAQQQPVAPELPPEPVMVEPPVVAAPVAEVAPVEVDSGRILPVDVDAPASAETAKDGPIVLSLSELAASKNITLKAQKNARVGIRKLIRQLDKEDEANWENTIGVAVASEPSIYHYVEAVTVKAAMVEAGATAEFAGRIVEAMRRSPLVPSTFNYGE